MRNLSYSSLMGGALCLTIMAGAYAIAVPTPAGGFCKVDTRWGKKESACPTTCPAGQTTWCERFCNSQGETYDVVCRCVDPEVTPAESNCPKRNADGGGQP